MTSDDLNKKIKKQYIISTIIFLVIGLPILVQAFIVPLTGIKSTVLGGAILCTITALLGFYYARTKQLPKSFCARYLPLVFPIIYILFCWEVTMYISDGYFTDNAFDMISLLFLPFLLVHIGSSLSGNYWYMLLIPLATYIPFVIGFFLATIKYKKFLEVRKGLIPVTFIFVVLFGILFWQTHERSYFLITENRQNMVTEQMDLYRYRPFNARNTLKTIPDPVGLSIEKDWPRLDGATAVYPIYAAATQAIYKNLNEQTISKYVDSNKTPMAYERLINGEADLIFAAEPSKQQIEMAKTQGVELIFVPFSREAFVFLTSTENPINNLSTQQIQDIYSGKINNWRDLNGKSERIVAFQRPENSGSQTIMLSQVMKNTEMAKPLETEVAEGMGGLIRRVANYNNGSSSIGYSFRYYATQMDGHNKIQLLSVDNISPTPENIGNNTYPFTIDVYMVTTNKASENTKSLMNWFLNPQGQKLIEDVGYIPIKTEKPNEE